MLPPAAHKSWEVGKTSVDVLVKATGEGEQTVLRSCGGKCTTYPGGIVPTRGSIPFAVAAFPGATYEDRYANALAACLKGGACPVLENVHVHGNASASHGSRESIREARSGIAVHYDGMGGARENHAV